MLVIRLSRTGRENLPSYRIVVSEKARAVKGRPLEVIGNYLPARDPAVFECKIDRVEHWVSKGATPSDTMARLLKHAGVKNMDKFIQKYTKQKSKKEAAAEGKEAAAPAAAAPTEKKEEVPAAAEAPKEEATVEKNDADESKDSKEQPAKE